MRPDDGALLRDYLLDRLPDDERRALEDRYFADDSYFERLAACEAELIRDYLRGALSPEDCAIVAARYLHTEDGRARIQFANELMAAGVALRPSGRSGIQRLGGLVRNFRMGWGFALAAGLLLAVGFIIRLEIESSRLRGEIERLTAAAQQPRQLPAAAPVLVSFLLRPDLERDVEARPKVLVVPHSAAAQSLIVRFQCELEPGQEAAHYQAALTIRPRGEIWSGRIERKADDDSVDVSIPAHLLSVGDYILTLNAVPPAVAHQSYFFRISSK